MRGLQLALGLASAEEMRGVQLSFFAAAQEMRGVQLGLVTVAEHKWGVSIGFANTAFESMTGLNVGAGNFAGGRDWEEYWREQVSHEGGWLDTYNTMTGRLSGLHVGGFNVTGTMKGLSLGLFNHAVDLTGVQIGILNHVASNPPWARWLPLVNARF
jgi:hypothetical protein